MEFGDDLSDASLRILGEIHKSFYFIIDWPLKLKPFYIHEEETQGFLNHLIYNTVI